MGVLCVSVTAGARVCLRSAPDHGDRAARPWSTREPAISGDQWSVVRLGDGDVGRVVGAEVGAQLPDAIQQPGDPDALKSEATPDADGALRRGLLDLAT